MGNTVILHPLETNRIAVSVGFLLQDLLVVNTSQVFSISFRYYAVYSISNKDHDAPKHQRHPRDWQLKMKTIMLPVKIRALVFPVNSQTHSITISKMRIIVSPSSITAIELPIIKHSQDSNKVSNTAHSMYLPSTQLIQLSSSSPKVCSVLTHIFYKWNISPIIFIFIDSSRKLIFSSFLVFHCWRRNIPNTAAPNQDTQRHYLEVSNRLLKNT